MVCKPDNNLVFEEEEFYTAFCDVCSCWVKIYKFRSCETRHQKLIENGVDVFKDLRELEKLASYQTGQSAALPPAKVDKSKAPSPKPSRRGR